MAKKIERKLDIDTRQSCNVDLNNVLVEAKEISKSSPT